MSESRTDRSESTADRVLGCVADETRRETVAVLRERPSAVSVEELAAAVAARRDERPSADVAEADRTSLAVELAHAHLPALADADLVDWHPGDDAVAATDHPAFDDEHLLELLSADRDTPELEVALRCLADARRRHIVSVLEDADGTVGRRALARRVAARESEESSSSVPQPTVDAVETSLYHVHLPTLREAGLVETDGETVGYGGNSDLAAAVLSFGLDRADEPTNPDADGATTPDDKVTAVEPPQTSFDEAGD